MSVFDTRKYKPETSASRWSTIPLFILSRTECGVHPAIVGFVKRPKNACRSPHREG